MIEQSIIETVTNGRNAASCLTGKCSWRRQGTSVVSVRLWPVSASQRKQVTYNGPPRPDCRAARVPAGRHAPDPRSCFASAVWIFHQPCVATGSGPAYGPIAAPLNTDRCMSSPEKIPVKVEQTRPSSQRHHPLYEASPKIYPRHASGLFANWRILLVILTQLFLR